MNDTIVNRWAMGLAIFSFGFLSIGSFLFGATATTSVFRGLGGGVLFGASLWLTGLLVIEEKVETEDNPLVDEDLGQGLGVIDPEAVRKKFLEKSNEIAKNSDQQKMKERDEAYNKEATPF
jgi:hypothetical protein